MAKEASGDRQTEAGASADRREGVAQVVQPDTLELRMAADRLPGLLQIGAGDRGG